MARLKAAKVKVDAAILIQLHFLITSCKHYFTDRHSTIRLGLDYLLYEI